MNKILELSSKVTKGGRRAIKLALLTIHQNDTDTNLNGIHWNEQYVLNNIDSLKGMSICAEFNDEKKEIPIGHGLTEVVECNNGVREPLFENSEVVGTIIKGAIEDVNINGDKKRLLVGYGYLYNQRYPNFVNWVNNNIINGINTDSSIEIMGVFENQNKIIYHEKDNATNEFRSPEIFDFSGTAILGITPADSNAIVLELNEKKHKEELEMDEKTLESVKEIIHSTIISELNDAEKLNNEITQLNSQLAEKDNTISELNASVEQLKKALEDLESEQKTYWAEREELEKQLAQARVAERLNEVNTKLANFTDDEIKVAESEINSYKAGDDNAKDITIDSIIAKICTNIVLKNKENEHINEINSEKVSEDIFSEINNDESNEAKNNNDDDVNIF